MTYQVLAKSLATTEITTDDTDVPARGLGKRLMTAILKRGRRLLPTDWRILQWDWETHESVISYHGSVEIRQIPAGCLAQTCVKGEMDVARTTALVRLAKYVGGYNQRAVSLDVERPVFQQQKAPGLWLIAIRLSAVDDMHAAPLPRTSKVRINAQPAMTCAVLTWPGRPTEHAIKRAEAAVMDALARTYWFTSGSPMLRIYAPGSIVPFWGSFQIAVPVYHRVATVPVPAQLEEPATTSRPVSWSSPPVR